MAAMVGARRALLAARYSPRGALAASAAPVPPCRLVDLPLSLPAERGCLQSLLPHRGTGSLASERTDEDHQREWAQNNTGSYGDPHSNHFNYKLRRDHPSVGSSAGVERNRGVNVGGSTNAQCGGNSEQPYRDPYSNHFNQKLQSDLPSVGSSTGDVGGSVNTRYGGNSEQPYGSGGSYGFPNSHQPHSSSRVNNETPGYNARQPYGSSSAYNQESLSGGLPNARQQYNGTEAKNGLSGYDKGQTYHHPNGYDTYNSGYNTQSNEKIHKGEAATTGQYGYVDHRSGGSYPSSTGNGQQVFQQQKYVDHRSGGSYPDRPASQYANPTGFHKENVAGIQQGNNSNFGYIASQGYQSPYVTGKADTYNNHQVHSMNQNTDVQHRPHGIYQATHSHIQPAASFGNHLNTAPHQDGIYHQIPPGNPSNYGSPSLVPNEVTQCKGTVEELEKLCEDGNVNEALEVLSMLQRKGTVLQAPHYLKLIQACGDATALAEARVIHNQISEPTPTPAPQSFDRLLLHLTTAGRKKTKQTLLEGFLIVALMAGGAMNSGSTQALIYSFVAKGSVVLAEHTAFSGNFSTVAVQCLQKLPPNSTRSTYSCDGHTFNFLVDRGFVFLVVADEAAGRSVPFVFLERVREDFMQRYGSSIDEEGQHPLADDANEDDFLFEDRFSIAYNLDREFGPRLKDHMQYCVNHPEEINKLSKVKAHLSEVKGIMMDNIEKILDRGEKIELLVGKTETLQSQADSFHRHGRELRRKMWLQNLRFKLMVGGGIAALILILWLMVCRGFKC